MPFIQQQKSGEVLVKSGGILVKSGDVLVKGGGALVKSGGVLVKSGGILTCYRLYPPDSANKTDCHNITAMLLKVALSTINQPTTILSRPRQPRQHI